MFSLVFRGFGGDEMIEHFLGTLPGVKVGNNPTEAGDLMAEIVSQL